MENFTFHALFDYRVREAVSVILGASLYAAITAGIYSAAHSNPLKLSPGSALLPAGDREPAPGSLPVLRLLQLHIAADIFVINRVWVTQPPRRLCRHFPEQRHALLQALPHLRIRTHSVGFHKPVPHLLRNIFVQKFIIFPRLKSNPRSLPTSQEIMRSNSFRTISFIWSMANRISLRQSPFTTYGTVFQNSLQQSSNIRPVGRCK